MGLMKRKSETKGSKPAANAGDGAVKAGSAKSADGAGRGRKSAFTGKRIYIVGKAKEGNPCRKGSVRAAHFDLIKEGMTFEDYTKAGGNNFNLKDGVERGYIDVR